ncbi:MAG: hypothetical protein Q4F49_08570 [Pseudoxanthomonas suwonensis]|nr:hypothetical protein [Pseudoxanthomonas suwonensis]
MLVGLSAGSHDALLEAVIETIAVRKGRKLTSPVREAVHAHGGGKVASYRHGYTQADAWSLKLDSLRRFIAALR